VNINAVLIDVEDVLFDCSWWHRWMHKLLARLGVVGKYDALMGKTSKWRTSYLPEVHRGQADFWQALQEHLGDLGLSCRQTQEVIAASRIQHRLFLDARRLTNVDRNQLMQMTNVIPVGLACNTFEQRKPFAKVLRRSGISDQVLTIVTSREVGHAMPDISFFSAACEAIQVSPSRNVALVSNNLTSLNAARELGMFTVGIGTDNALDQDLRFDQFEPFATSLLRQSNATRAAA
jgi:FMN phosphatase YigB (HAD superfamily)